MFEALTFVFTCKVPPPPLVGVGCRKVLGPSADCADVTLRSSVLLGRDRFGTNLMKAAKESVLYCFH